MSDDKRDFLIAIISLLIVAFIVGVSSLSQQDETPADKNEPAQFVMWDSQK